MGSLVSAVAPIAGAAIGSSFGNPGLGAQLGGMVGGALAGSQGVAQDNRNLQQAAQMSQFRPIGVTTNFGTSNFGFDDQGRLNQAGYNLSPQLQGYQDQLAGMTGQGLQAGQGLMSLGQQYLGESPEAVRQRYIQQQTALLAPENEQTLAGIRNNLFQTGRGGLATGATNEGGLAATNPEMAAYYNALAKQQAQLAAGADTAAQNQIKFGQGLLTDAYSPFTAGLGAQKNVEGLGQQSLTLGTEIGQMSTGGSQKAGNLLTEQTDPTNYALQKLLGNQQLMSGVGNWFGGSASPSSSAGAGPAGYFSNIGSVDTSSWM
jgi:hypothetical protein